MEGHRRSRGVACASASNPLRQGSESGRALLAGGRCRGLLGALPEAEFKELSERLEALRERHQQGLLLSVEFLKELLNLARDVVTAEQTLPPVDKDDRGKAALTELFQETRNDNTPVMVERVVNDIDGIVRIVRFDGWQTTHAGEREVKNALRRTLFRYKLHQDQELFDRAYGDIRTYY
jgi:type I restriction enzyme, R subunit